MEEKDVKIDIGDVELDQEEKEDKKKDKKKEKHVSRGEYEKLLEEYNKMCEKYALAMNTASHHQNLKNQYEKEYERMMKYRSQALMEALLPSLDSFQLAFKYDAPNKEAQNYKMGFEFVYKMMVDALQSEGMSIILPKVKDEFDPTKHQVVEVEDTLNAEDDNKICEIMLNGYMVKDRVIRPASVKIYKLKKEENKEVEENVDINDETKN